MKYILTLLCILASCAWAQPEAMPPLICSGVTTSTVAVTATGPRIDAYINALQIGVQPAEVTATVTVATSGILAARTLYSATVTGTNVVYPTNSIGMKRFLAGDALVLSASTGAHGTNVVSATVTAIPVIERQP